MIRIKLYGDKATSDIYPLGDDFERGSRKKVFFNSLNVGTVKKIRVTTDLYSLLSKVQLNSDAKRSLSLKQPRNSLSLV